MAAGFNLRADIDFREPRDQSVSSMLVSANNRLSFSLFDRSDESMVNDYEALVTGIEAGGDVVEFFKSLIDDFLLSNPVAVRADVDKAWEDMPMPQRLVFDSPLPLVEEQRKILSAIKHRDSRLIAVEGPPGTGKSHTITAVAFDLILSGKSLLVLSDKKEALDVVEGKLNQALAKVRPSDDFPNPILRLGKDASNYSKLLKKSAVERLQVNQQVVRRERPKRKKALEEEHKALTAGLEGATKAYAEVDLLEIAELERDIASFVDEMPHARAVLEDRHLTALIDDFNIVADFVQSQPVLTALLRWRGSHPRRLAEIAHLHKVLASSPVKALDIAPVSVFSLERLRALEAIIAELEAMRNVVFGYVFAGKKIRFAAAALQERCSLEYEKPHRALPKLKELRSNLRKLYEGLAADQVEADFESAVVLVASRLSGSGQSTLIPPHVLESARRLEEAMLQDTPLLTVARGASIQRCLPARTAPSHR